MSDSVVVLLAHGTADPAGQASLEELRSVVADRLRRAGSTTPVRLAFADVIGPSPEQVLSGTSGAVVVPIFLTSGYHVQVDVPAAAASAEAVTVTPALGADPLVVAAVARRVRELPGSAPRRLLLVGAGSAREAARAEVAAAAKELSELLSVPVEVAFLSGPGPRLDDLLVDHESRAAADGHDWSGTVVASYLLAPGYFASKAHRLAASQGLRVSAPLGVAPELIELILTRVHDTIANPRTPATPATIAS